MPERRHDLLERLEEIDTFARGPGNFAESPRNDMDAFSEILSGVKLNGAVFFSAEFSAPWGFSASASDKMATELAPGAEHLVLYHFLVDGSALVQMPDGRSLELHSGDIVIFPHGDPHHLMSDRATKPPFPSYGISAKIKARDLRPLQAGGGGDTARFVCGYMTCDPYLSRPILSGLPPVFKVNIRTDRSGHWLRIPFCTRWKKLLREASAAKPCWPTFGSLVRRHPEALRGRFAGTANGLAGGHRDPIVGKSLGLLHGRVAYPWTIADLADEVGISRSALVERFTKYLSEPPMTYLTRWRLQLAARSLEKTSRGFAEIAAGVGYESEAAFNRAFKREYGQPPGRYRSEHKSASARALGEPNAEAAGSLAPRQKLKRRENCNSLGPGPVS